MSVALTLLIVVLSITVLGLVFAELIFANKPGWQDLICRLILCATLIVPATILFAALVIPNGLVNLPVLRSAEQPAPPSKRPSSVAKDSSEEGPGNRQASSATPQPTGASVRSGIADANLAASTAVVVDSESRGRSKLSWFGLLSAIWCVGSGLFLVYFAVGWLGLQKIKRSAVLLTSNQWNEIAKRIALDLNLKRPLCIASSANVSTPLVAGVTKPTILIPNSLVADSKAIGENKQQIKAILGHEAMHVRRCDTAWNLLSCFALILWWPVPTVHWMRRRMVLVRELLCDANAVKEVGVVDYAETLLGMATAPMQRRLGLLTLSMQPSARSLETRVRWILDRSLSAAGVPGNTMQRLAWCCLALVLAISASVRLVPADFATSSSENSVVQEENSHVRGKVHKNEDTPVVGATVYLKQYWPMPGQFVTRTTDADGAFEFGEVEPGRYMLWAEGDGLTSMEKFWHGKRVKVVAGADPDPVDMKLIEACNYEVKVISSVDNTPIENAEITFVYSDIGRTFQTDMAGTAEIKGLSQYAWFFLVKADGFATASDKTAIQELGTTTEIQFSLNPGASIKGTLLDQNEDPVSDAEIYFLSGEVTASPGFGKATTNMQGEYDLAGLPMNEKIIVKTSADGYKLLSQEIVLTDGAASTDVNLVCEKLPYGGDAVITVLSEDGMPVEGAELFNRGTANGDVRTATTNAEGNARLVNMCKFLEDGCKVVIRAKGKVPILFMMEPGSEEDPTTKTVTLANGKTLRGQLLTPEGEPAGGVSVFLYDVYKSPSSADLKDLMWPRVSTDAKGKFESHEMEGDTDITVYTPPNCAPIKSLAVALDGDETEITIKMEPAARIRVRAIDSETGDPIPVFNVKLDRVEELDLLDGDLLPKFFPASLANPGRNVRGTGREYVLDGQTPNAVYRAIVSAEGYEPVKIKRLRSEVNAEVHVVKLVNSSDE